MAVVVEVVKLKLTLDGKPRLLCMPADHLIDKMHLLRMI